ncbi:hypothetical protein ABLB95_15410 (plasmid) [Acinetobacter radioresistens]|uniref:hypothetical protein n=1 Tax=Acinetobacter radioresistens TaxID=40216 RepID=UPI000DACD59F|nr:hypothetical protein [Acinetobacter radioresistens]AWV87037.1 hypothetical protein DOM24_10725 [Acinetobacter radioresistens]MCU4595365.1 hypothetical protein [Acinetobacter radioresistens]MCX0328910.1 hypothetical protein [Acinetobacter radioresistens]
MSKPKITQRISLLLHRHNNTEATVKELEQWTAERRDFFLSKLDWMEKSIDSGNHEAYRIAFNQLKSAIISQKDTLDKVHDMLIYEAED